MYHVLFGRNPCSGRQFKGSIIWCFASHVFDCKVIIKIKNNPQWQICFQKVSHSFSIIPEKYCTIVLTPIECFDRGLMYYPVFPVIQMPPPFVLGSNVRVWYAPLGSLLLYPDTCYAILNFDLNKKKLLQKMLFKLDLCWILPGAFLQMILFLKLI